MEEFAFGEYVFCVIMACLIVEKYLNTIMTVKNAKLSTIEGSVIAMELGVLRLLIVYNLPTHGIESAKCRLQMLKKG